MSLEIIAAGMKMKREMKMNMGKVKGKVICNVSLYSLAD